MRECGSCSLCCKVLEVEALYKNAGQWCRFHKAGLGCTSHQLRPKACRDFDCVWRQEDWLGPEWKPDTSRFVLAWEYGGDCLAVHVDPQQPNAWKRDPYGVTLRALAERHMGENRIVMIVDPTKRTLLMPDKEIVVGSPKDKFEWTIRKTAGPTGPVFDVDFRLAGKGKAA